MSSAVPSTYGRPTSTVNAPAANPLPANNKPIAHSLFPLANSVTSHSGIADTQNNRIFIFNSAIRLKGSDTIKKFNEEMAARLGHSAQEKKFLIRESGAAGCLTVEVLRSIDDPASFSMIRFNYIKVNQTDYVWKINHSENCYQNTMSMTPLQLEQTEAKDKLLEAIYDVFQERSQSKDPAIQKIYRCFNSVSKEDFLSMLLYPSQDQSTIHSAYKMYALSEHNNGQKLETIEGELTCSIYKMAIPEGKAVITADGHIFNIDAIKQWEVLCLRKGQPVTNPVTHKPIDMESLRPVKGFPKILKKTNSLSLYDAEEEKESC